MALFSVNFCKVSGPFLSLTLPLKSNNLTVALCYCWILISSESGQYTVHQQCHCDPCQVLVLAWRISVKSDPLPSPGPDGPAATRSSSILCVSCWSCGVVETPAVDETKTEGWTDALTANGGSVIVCSSCGVFFFCLYTLHKWRQKRPYPCVLQQKHFVMHFDKWKKRCRLSTLTTVLNYRIDLIFFLF